MSEASAINVSINIPNDNRRPSKVRQMLTLQQVINSIQSHDNLDEYTKNGLIEIAQKYPLSAMHNFINNFNLMISRVRAKRQRDQSGDFTPKAAVERNYGVKPTRRTVSIEDIQSQLGKSKTELADPDTEWQEEGRNDVQEQNKEEKCE